MGPCQTRRSQNRETLCVCVDARTCRDAASKGAVKTQTRCLDPNLIKDVCGIARTAATGTASAGTAVTFGTGISVATGLGCRF